MYKSLDELRDIYVRNSLKEYFGGLAGADVYLAIPPPPGDPNDLKAWLAAWREVADKVIPPSDMDHGAFTKFLVRAQGGPNQKFEKLVNYLNTQGTLYEWGQDSEHPDRVQFLFQYTLEGGGKEFAVFGRSNLMLRPQDVAVYFAEINVTAGPTQGKGFQWLSTCLREAFEAERAAAIARFNRACAVTPDGLKIISAKYVYVIWLDSAAVSLIASEAFRDEKIILQEYDSRGRDRNDGENVAIEAGLQVRLRPGYSMFLRDLTVGEGGPGTALIVRSDMIPKALLSRLRPGHAAPAREVAPPTLLNS